MIIIHRRSTLAVQFAAVSLALLTPACGGAGPGDPTPGTASIEKTGKAAQDLTLLGVELPVPTITLGLNDASVKFDPLGVIESLLPDGGIVLSDPFKPLEDLIGALQDGGKTTVENPFVTATFTLPGLPIPTIPDPFDGGGIPIITP
jgi:hypothetical protein